MARQQSERALQAGRSAGLIGAAAKLRQVMLLRRWRKVSSDLDAAVKRRLQEHHRLEIGDLS
jgi:hypothetical protein